MGTTSKFIAAAVILPVAFGAARAYVTATSLDDTEGTTYSFVSPEGDSTAPTEVLIRSAQTKSYFPPFWADTTLTRADYKLAVGQVCISTAEVKAWGLSSDTTKSSYCRSITDSDLPDISKALSEAGAPHVPVRVARVSPTFATIAN